MGLFKKIHLVSLHLNAGKTKAPVKHTHPRVKTLKHANCRTRQVLSWLHDGVTYHKSHVVQRPMKIEKTAEPAALGLFPLMATCTHTKTPTILAGINLSEDRIASTATSQ